MNKSLHKYARVTLIGLIVVSLLLTACGEKKKSYTVGVISLSANLDETVDTFKEGMAELGYVEGENITYIYNGVTPMGELDTEAQELVDAKVDLILSLTTPATQASQRAVEGTDIPVVFIPVTDPVAAGIVDSLAKPGGNITGVTFGAQEGQRFEWMLQAVPTIQKVYIAYNPEDQSPVLALEAVKETATKLGVEIITREANSPEAAEAAFANIPEEADAIFFLPDSVVNARVVEWIDLAIERKLSTSGSNSDLLGDGTLTSYGIDLTIAGKEQAARLVDQIFQGTPPSDLPVEMADFFTGINLATANAMGIEIPEDTLRQADIIIR